MTSEENRYELEDRIQRYLSGEMPETERAELEAFFQENPEAGEEFLFSKDLNWLIQNKEEASVMALIAATSKKINLEPDFEGLEQYEQPPSLETFRKPFNGKALWWGAGLLAIILITGITWFFLFEKPAQDAIRLAENFMTPLENALITSENDGFLHAGMTAYEEARYEEAAEYLGKYLDRRPDDNARLYQAISLLLSGKGQQGEAVFLELEKKNNPITKGTASWYLALYYLKNRAPDKAKERLNLLTEHPIYGERSRELLQKLRN